MGKERNRTIYTDQQLQESADYNAFEHPDYYFDGGSSEQQSLDKISDLSFEVLMLRAKIREIHG